MVKKYLKSAFILILFTIFIKINISYAQRTEVGVFLGGAYYIGDLNPSKHFLDIRPAFGGTFRYMFNTRWVLKGNFLAGYVEGSDASSGFNIRRNLSFASKVIEAAVGAEFNFFPYVPGNPKMKISPYIFAMVGIFNFNPTAEYNGRTYELQPLGTEGQGTSLGIEPYSLVSTCLPFGIGVKFSTFKGTTIAIEYGLRATNTDYLDDVSTVYVDPVILATQNTPISAIMADRSTEKHQPGEQRGNSKNTDMYSFFGVSLNLRINLQGKKYCPAYKVPTKRSKERIFEKH